MKLIMGLATAAAIILCAASAQADIKVIDQTVYFNVDGKTPAEIYEAMLRQSSVLLDGKRTLASITSKLKQTGKVRETGNSRKFGDYTLELSFIIKRPRLMNEQSLSVAEREDWRGLSEFIAKHESAHRDIWIRCATELDRGVRDIEELSYKDVVAKTNVLWKQMIENCDKEQKLFDRAQSIVLMNQPFVVKARSGGS